MSVLFYDHTFVKANNIRFNKEFVFTDDRVKEKREKYLTDGHFKGILTILG